MGQQGEKKATVIVKYNGATYGPFESVKVTGRKMTRASSKKRSGAGQARKLRVGAEDVENGTYTFEDDGTVPFETLWENARKAEWSLTETPADDDGNPRANDARSFTGKQVGLQPGDVDIENDEDVDYVDVELILRRA